MNKSEAIKAMQEGVKITHIYFTPDEWMTIENNRILLEDGVICSQNEFWKWRSEKCWDDGYSIFQPSKDIK